MSRALTVVAMAACVGFALMYWQERSLNEVLRKQLEVVRSEAAAPKLGAVDEVAVETETVVNQVKEVGGLDKTQDLGRTQESNGRRSLKRDFAEWSSEQHLKEIEAQVELSGDERQRLAEELRRSFASDPSPAAPERLAKIMQELGFAGQAELYLQGMAEQQATKLKREIDDQVVLLTSRLALSEEQGGRVRQALAEVEGQLKPLAIKQSQKLAEVMMGHFRGAEPQGEKDLKRSYQQLSEVEDTLKQERERLLRERLPEVLTPEQFTKWSAEQAQANGR